MCGKASAHLEKSKREDKLNSREEINFIITRERIVDQLLYQLVGNSQLIWSPRDQLI